MLEGCITVTYTCSTLFFASVFLTTTLGGCRGALQYVDTLWGLLLAMAVVVYCSSMLATISGAGACAGWL